jgi:hypothetical protein
MYVLAVNMMVKIARSGPEEGHHLGPLAREEGPWAMHGVTQLGVWRVSLRGAPTRIEEEHELLDISKKITVVSGN